MKHPLLSTAAGPVLAALISVTLLLACALPVQAGIKEGVQDFLYEKKAFDTVEDYTENAVLPTLSLMVEELSIFKQACDGLEKSRTDEAVAKAAKAWHAAMNRFNIAWVFNYGPGGHYDFHKQLATWPFDKYLVDYYLKDIKAGKLKVDATFLRTNKHSATRGLHTAGYLLFRKGSARKAADITDAEISYLGAVCQALVEEGIDYEAAWRGTANLTVAKKEILKKAGITRQRPSYAWEFANPGEKNSRYVSVSVPLQEIFQEATTVVEDMIPAIEELLDYTPETAPYWVYVDPYADILSRFQGVEEAYYGGLEGSRGASLSDLVAKKDAVLDRRVKAALAHVKKRIQSIRDLNANTPKETKELMIRIAVGEAEKLMERLTTATPLVTADQVLKPWAAYVHYDK
ncbi:MAG: Imelysin [Desulfobacter sp.]|nr:MAG: Imelysin [Desulfobacter sp.]